jgi:hypothetical protein
MRQRLPYLLLSLLILFCSSSLFSQAVRDSIANDSLNKEFKKQVNKNNQNIGIDTTYLESDTITFAKYPRDSVANVIPKKTEGRPAHVRRFYWNERRANADSLGNGKKYRHSPLHAALFSMALPGLGQTYNRKYWKIPIVYAGFAGLGYAIYHTGSNFRGYRAAYRLQVDGDANTYGSFKGVDDVATLKQYRDFYKRNLDISVIATAVWYILNVVDAAVDAHLFEWNMKDDLSLSWHPTVITGPAFGQTTAGIKLNLRF